MPHLTRLESVTLLLIQGTTIAVTVATIIILITTAVIWLFM